MDEESKGIVMETDTKASSKATNLMVKAFTHGSMGRYMKVSGKTGSKKGREFGREFSEIHISGSGHKARLMVTACISGKTATDTKENGIFVSSTVKELICLQMVTPTSVSMLMANHVVQDSTNGKMDRFM
mgnify:CR=1 FL=1